MYPIPSGPDLSSEACRDLDDHFFASDPTGYFLSKVDSLLTWADVETPQCPSSPTRSRFEDLLGSVARIRCPTPPDQRRRQVAADAVQLRHQVAEALLRLVHARLTCRASAEACSLWVALTQGPANLHNLLKELRAYVEREDYPSVLAGLTLPVPDGTGLDRGMLAAVRDASSWLQRAAEVVSSGEINLNAASNKLKHGVAVRPDDRLRVTFTAQPPDQNGNVSLAALTSDSAIDVFDTIVLEYLARPPKDPEREAHGLERTLLRVDTPVMLAEAWMMAIIHGAVFETAAYRHQADRARHRVAADPVSIPNVTPSDLLGVHVVGMRFPLTTTSSGRIHRPPGMQLTDGTFLTLEFGEGRSGVVVTG